MTSTNTRQQGFSLIELMVATTIGLIITLLIGQIFINSRQMFSSTDNLSRMQENARYALSVLTRAVRTSAHRTDPRYPKNDYTEPGPPSVTVYGLFRTANTLQGAEGGTTGTPATGIPDSFTVLFQGMGDGAGNADGTVQNCAGARIDATLVPYPMTWTSAYAGVYQANQYLIMNDPANNNEPTLFCNTTPASACTPPSATCLPLVPGVENMQIVYGEDLIGPVGTPVSLSPDGSIDRFVTATDVVNWNNVLSMRISLLMRSDDRVASMPTPSSTAYLMNGTNVYAPGTDTRVRRVFTAVIDLRNRTQ